MILNFALFVVIISNCFYIKYLFKIFIIIIVKSHLIYQFINDLNLINFFLKFQSSLM